MEKDYSRCLISLFYMYEINKKMKLFPDIPEERRILYSKKEEENYNREYVNEEDWYEAIDIYRGE